MIYLASPYSHPDPEVRDRRFRAVCKFAGELALRGLVVFCPIAHSVPMEKYGNLPGTWEFWKKQDLPMLDLATELHVAAFPGWEDSEGVSAEIEHWYDTNLFPPIYHHFEELPV